MPDMENRQQSQKGKGKQAAESPPDLFQIPDAAEMGEILSDPVLQAAGIHADYQTSHNVLDRAVFHGKPLAELVGFSTMELLQKLLDSRPPRPAPAGDPKKDGREAQKGAKGNGTATAKKAPPAKPGSPEALKAALEAMKQRAKIKAAPIPAAPAADKDAKAFVFIDQDGLAAKIRITAPHGNGKPLSEAALYEAIEFAGVCVGVQKKFVSRLAQFPVYERLFKIAEGTPPKDGVDGRLKCHFDTDMSLRPKQNDDGTVDYRELGYIRNVKEGDILCEILPPEPAAEGIDVLGNPIPCYEGQPISDPCGANTALTEDGTRVVALCDGEVSLLKGKVLVNQVKTVKMVDLETGNIAFGGSVVIEGDVHSGFEVHAGGDITVKGIVEDAVLSAGGNVVLLKGMNGNSSGKITAGRTVRSRFLENATVKAKKHIYADVVLNCTLECGHRVQLTGGRGCMQGGVCRVAREFAANELGNNAGMPTRVELNVEKGLEAEREEMMAQIVRYEETAEQLTAILQAAPMAELDEGTRLTAVIRAAAVRDRMRREMVRLREEIAKVSEQIENGVPEAGIVVLKTLFPNVVVEIDGMSQYVRVQQQRCRIHKENGELVFGGVENASKYR